MIFENLLINNFGVYCGKQNFDLTTKSKKPVILIGALNGSGKTTFLQAIDFVLYGKFSNYFYSQKLSYENFLTKNINKKNFDEGAQIELVFNRKYKGKKQKFKISRNWKLVGKKMKEEFFVFIDDKYDEDITKDWDNFVDQILPSRVASLFFFDGEKIEQLADLDESKKVLKKAILLGGSSIKDFSSSTGKKGSFQQNFNVYGKKGSKCPNKYCKAKIKKISLSNRSSFFCPECQK